MYYIYHIPTFVWKDGSIGKIGCTQQKPKVRVNKQGYSDFEVLETHDCIDIASIREQELQKEYGYPVDKVPYKVSYNNRPKLDTSSELQSKRGKIMTPKRIEYCKTAGIKNGKVNRVSILQYTKDGDFVNEWKSIRGAARYFKLAHTNLVTHLKSGKSSFAGYKWKYKDSTS